MHFGYKGMLVRKCRHIALALCLLLGIFFVAMVAVSAIPSEQTAVAVKRIHDANHFSAEYPRVLGRVTDMYTECVALGIAMNLKPQIDSLLSAQHFGSCTSLHEALTAANPQTATYYRYVHGYQLFVKPLYTWLSFEQVRIAVAGSISLLLLLLFTVVYIRIGKIYACAVLIGFLSISSMHIFTLVTHGSQFMVVLCGAICTIFSTEKDNLPLVTFSVIGACDALFSFLNMGSLSLGMALLMYCFVRYKQSNLQGQGEYWHVARDIFLCCCAWSIGFVLPWCIKWGLVKYFLPSVNILGATVDIYLINNVRMFFTALQNNFAYTVWYVWVPLLCAAVFVRVHLRLSQPSNTYILVFPALIPIVWMGIIPGQSGVLHAHFVYILLWPMISTFFMLALVSKEHFWEQHIEQVQAKFASWMLKPPKVG